MTRARAERLITIVLFALAVLVSGIYLATHFRAVFHVQRLFGGEDHIYFTVPLATGLTEGLEVSLIEVSASRRVGRVASVKPLASGVEVNIALEESLTLFSGAHVLYNPATGAIQIVSSGTGAPVAFPATLPAEIAVARPESLLEPSPRWPRRQEARPSAGRPGLDARVGL